METKHSKGNWTFSPMKGAQNHCCMAQVWDANGFNLASIDSRYGEVEATANAKLIAAAPDLLAAISELHDLAMDGYDSHVKSGTHSEFLKEDREVLKNALRAIKKAIE